MRACYLFAFLSLVHSCTPTLAHAAAPKSVRFIVLGDGGTGEKGQLLVAKAIAEVCKARQCDFALGAGDNIYEYGVSSAEDPQFQAKFEKPYAELNFPFYMALGNHDQSGTVPGSGVHPERGDFEVQYTSHSKKWKMPSRYYSISKSIIDILVVDSNPLAPQNKPQFDWYLPGAKYDLAQRSWAREALAKSKARWKVVLAHHPYRSNGKHGNAGEFEGLGLATGEKLKKWYEEDFCGKIDVLFAGHDHNLQWLPPYKDCGEKTQFVVSGAAAKANGPKSSDPASRSNSAVWESYGKLGFFWVEATDAQMKLAGYTVDEAGHARLEIERPLNLKR